MSLKKSKRIGANKSRKLDVSRALRKDKRKNAIKKAAAGVMRPLIGMLCCGIVVLGGIWAWNRLEASPFLTVKNVTVTGNVFIPDSVLKEMTD